LIVKPRRLYFVNVQERVFSSAKAEDLRLLHADIDTLFVMSASGRIERVNDPEGSSGPRLFFAGCRFGNVARVRYDVDDRVARKMLEIAAEEPPWRDPDATPGCLGKIVELLSDRQPATIAFHALIYKLSNGLRHEHHPAPIVRGDSPEGRQMMARFAERGMPAYAVDAGFRGVGDFWEPWCAALDAGEMASVAFAARLGKMGAEVGVYTFPKYRGHGFAAAVTASWATIPSLERRALFYSTHKSNRSSRRVAARLGLRMIGASVSIA
jgi:hypothetical protein